MPWRPDSPDRTDILAAMDPDAARRIIKAASYRHWPQSQFRCICGFQPQPEKLAEFEEPDYAQARMLEHYQTKLPWWRVYMHGMTYYGIPGHPLKVENGILLTSCIYLTCAKCNKKWLIFHPVRDSMKRPPTKKVAQEAAAEHLRDVVTRIVYPRQREALQD